MAINSTDTKIKTSGDGATRTFSFPFKIFQNTDIVVQKIDKDTDVATTLTLGTDYTVSINTVTEGGTITISVAKTPSANEWVFIYSNLPFTQTVVLPTDGAFREISVSNGMDRLCRLIQQVQERAERSIVQRADITATEIVMPEPESNKILGWNEAGDELENKTGLDEAIEACDAAQTAAETAATNAGTAATNAGTAATNAGTARIDAETAQGLAEDARDAAIAAADRVPEPEAGDAGKIIVVNGDEDGYEITEFPSSEQHLIFNDTKPNNTAGGTFTSGAWRTRDLNTILYNSIPGYAGVFTAGKSGDINYLVVGGGGGGGYGYGGGGGAGGYRSGTKSVTAQDYSISIGVGGAGSTVDTAKGANGGDSTFDDITSLGGGGGGSLDTSVRAGASGGSGGGGSTEQSLGTGGAGEAGQGYAGGKANDSSGSDQGGGGGGGASEVGADRASTVGAVGGDGTEWLNGTTYAGGGGGGQVAGSAATGGAGGGGTGGQNAAGGNATANTGSGGGGGGSATSSGGNGANGIVIIRCLTADFTEGGNYLNSGGDISVVGEYTYHSFSPILSSNQFVLPAGTYLIEASAPGHTCGLHKAKLRNVTDSEDTLIGTSESMPTSGATTRSFVVGKFTIASETTFELQHQCGTTRATDGFGLQSNFSVEEVYSQVKITKLA